MNRLLQSSGRIILETDFDNLLERIIDSEIAFVPVSTKILSSPKI